MPRLDYLVVFPHAVDKLDDVLDILRKYRDLEVLYIKNHEPHDFIQFIEDMYKTDTVPWQHIVGKTKYLHNLGKYVYIILLRNHAPEEVIVGEGEYAHAQCMLINRFKWEVREKLNPVIDKERSEHHVIHASDYESQVYKFWEVMDLHPISSILSSPNNTLEHVPFHLPAFTKFEIKEVNIEDLVALQMIVNNDNISLPIKESIYYRYVVGDKQPYTDYWTAFRGERLWDDKSPGAYDKLIDEYKQDENYPIVRDGIILDGNHRLSILLSKGIKKCKIIQI